MFYYQKEFVKKKVSGEIAFDVISLFHVQIQEPKRRSTTTRACLSCKILLSQNIWNKKSMMTYMFAWMNIAPVASL